MITRDYCLTMARYNAWQNSQLSRILETVPEAELQRDRQAFFGSLMGTLSHLLWGDLMWMARFDGGASPTGGIPGSPDRTPTLAAWTAERDETDVRILDWARAVSEDALSGNLTWFSAAINAEVTRPLSLCVSHFFNHQTHHRGQIHAMLTAAGAQAPVSDLFLMPEGI